MLVWSCPNNDCICCITALLATLMWSFIPVISCLVSDMVVSNLLSLWSVACIFDSIMVLICCSKFFCKSENLVVDVEGSLTISSSSDVKLGSPMTFTLAFLWMVVKAAKVLRSSDFLACTMATNALLMAICADGGGVCAETIHVVLFKGLTTDACQPMLFNAVVRSWHVVDVSKCLIIHKVASWWISPSCGQILPGSNVGRNVARSVRLQRMANVLDNCTTPNAVLCFFASATASSKSVPGIWMMA